MKNLREINERMLQLEDVLATREMNDAEKQEYAALEREYKAALRANDIATREAGKPAPTFSLVKALREARNNGSKQFEVRSALTAAGLAGKAVDVELQNILEPLYAKSVLAQLGVKWYKGMPMGDISIPVMGKGSVLWKGETVASADGTPAFDTNITLKPKRLTAFFEISEQMLLQDTLGVEEAIKRDAINALKDKLEATILGNAAGSATQPAGIFYGKTLADATTFAKVCEIEAGVEDANVYGEMKYLCSTKAKADFRSMAKSTKNTQLVMEGGNIDGTPAIATSNVKNGTKGVYCYGDFSNLAVASWSDLIFKVDDSINYQNGLIRIYVSGYFDAAKLREAAFAYGDTRKQA